MQTCNCGGPIYNFEWQFMNNEKQMLSISQIDRMKRLGTCATIAGLCFAGFWKLLDHRILFEEWQFQLLSILLITAGVLVLAYGSIWSWIYNWAVTRIRKHNEKIAARKIRPQFLKLVNAFAEVSLTDRHLTIPNCLRELRNSNPNLLNSDFRFCNLWRSFDNSGWQTIDRKQEFIILLQWFDSLVCVFNEQIVCEPIRTLSYNPSLKLPYDWHNNFHNAKTEYDAFIREYKQFAREANVLGIGLRDYFEAPKVFLSEKV